MSSTFPSVLTSYTNPNPTDRLNSPSHSGIETNQNSGLGQVEKVIGVEGSSSVVGTLQYLVKSPASNGGGHVQTANTGGTGQTSYTKGDMLVAQSSSVISKLAIGTTNGYALVVDSTQQAGVKWGLPGNSPTVRVYSSVVTIWNKPSVLSYIVVECQGAGAAGAGCSASSGLASGGGSAGGYSRKVIAAANLPIAASVLAGSGGASVLGNGTSGAGSLSYFGSIMSATGATGTTGTFTPGTPGIGIGGDINVTGGYGFAGYVAAKTNNAGNGGPSYFGGGALGVISGNAGNGNAATTPGTGGGGAVSSGGQTTGGQGADGIVIVYEY